MLSRLQPEVGFWYENREDHSLFEIVSLDEDTVAIQFYEGEIEELEFEEFASLPLRPIQQPEDWSGPFEFDMEDRDESDFLDGSFANQSETATYNRAYYTDDYDSNTMHLMDDF